MAKQYITDQILETAKQIEDPEKRINVLMLSTHTLPPADGMVILTSCWKSVADMEPEKKVLWLARYHQHETRINKALEAQNNG